MTVRAKMTTIVPQSIRTQRCLSFKIALFRLWENISSKLNHSFNDYSKRIKAKLRVRDDDEETAVPAQFNTSLNQLKNIMGYGHKFYEAMYKMDLRLPSATQYTQS